MARTKQRLKTSEFLELHPRCCYCNGSRAAQERDHAPARIIFRDKQGPEDLEFPSCPECNRATAISEQVAAFYIRAFDSTTVPITQEEFDKLVSGLCNNAPDAVPYQTYDQNFAYLDEPDQIITVPPKARAHIDLVGTKLLYALHYRATGKIANPTQRRVVIWAQAGTEAAQTVIGNAEQWFDKREVGKRRNVDLGNQFCYRTGYSENHGYFGLQMSFGEALVFFCILGPAKPMVKLKPKPPLYVHLNKLGAALQPRKA